MAVSVATLTNGDAGQKKVGGVDDVPNDGTGVLKLDPWLSPFQDALKRRFARAQDWIKTIDETEGGLDKFSRVSLHLVAPIQLNPN